MQENNTPHYILPNDFIIKLRHLASDYESRSGLYQFGIYLMLVNKFPKICDNFPTDKPTLIKCINQKNQCAFKIWGEHQQGNWELTDLFQHDESLNLFFEEKQVTKVNPSELIPIEAKEISHDVFDIIRINKGHIIQYKQSNNLSCFFGAKDFQTRFKQISFINTLLDYYSLPLPEGQTITSDETYCQYIQALRILVTLVLFHKHKIDGSYWLRSSKSSALTQLLDEALQLDNETNPLDEITKACLFQETYEAMKTGRLKYKANTQMKQKINPQDWFEFQSFVTQEYKKLDKKAYTNFPITRILVPVISVPFEWTGIAIGLVVAGGVEQSTKLLSTKLGLISMVGSGMISVLGGGGVPAAIILAKPIIDNFARGFCNVSFAWIFGKTFKLAGSFVGLTTGLGLDSGYHFLRYFGSQLGSLLKKGMKETHQSGISLIDGTCFIKGIPCHLTESSNKSINHQIDINQLLNQKIESSTPQVLDNKIEQPVSFEVNQDGFILQVGEEEQKIPWNETDPTVRQFFENNVYQPEGYDNIETNHNTIQQHDKEKEELIVSHNPFL